LESYASSKGVKKLDCYNLCSVALFFRKNSKIKKNNKNPSNFLKLKILKEQGAKMLKEQVRKRGKKKHLYQ